MNNEEKILSLLEILVKDVGEVKQDVASLKQDVADLKEDVAGLKQDVAVLKEDVATLKKDVRVLEQKFESMKETQEEMQAQQKENTDYIKALVHSAELHKAQYDGVQLTVARLEGSASKINHIEAILKDLTYDVYRLKAAQ